MAYINENNVAYGVLTGDASNGELLTAQDIQCKHMLAVYRDGTYEADPEELRENLARVYYPKGAEIELEDLEPYWYSPAAQVVARSIIINDNPSNAYITRGGDELTEAELKDISYISYAYVTAEDWYSVTTKLTELENRITALES